ncbi:MAG: hypothetical protein QOI12_4198 [Alphaproteobacteria bacterium]|jgi:hypothetical protein|nr:hypothetical protein [Alphaproteobacteria bacterium]
MAGHIWACASALLVLVNTPALGQDCKGDYPRPVTDSPYAANRVLSALWLPVLY